MGSQTRMIARTTRGYKDGVAEVDLLRLEMIATRAMVVRAKEARDMARLVAIEDP